MYLCNPAHRYMYLRVWSIVSTYIYLRASASIDSIASQPASQPASQAHHTVHVHCHNHVYCVH